MSLDDARPGELRRVRERADIVRPSRLQGFSDAVFATAATLLIIPIRKFELEHEETLKEALLKRYPQLIVFVIGFLVICNIWESHIVRFKVIARVDDVIVALTLVSLMCTTFLPFTVELEGYYGEYVTPTVLNCMMLLTLELLELAIFVYAFRTPKLLSRRFRELDANEFVAKRKQIYLKVTCNCALFIVAAIFSVVSVVISWVLITSVIGRPYLMRLISYCTPSSLASSYDVLSGRIDKERIEYFTDAAVAIIATLLILDLTTEEFPKRHTIKEKGIDQSLKDMRQNFVAYTGTYVTVAIMWFVHHSVLHHIKMFTASMVTLNHVFLAFLAGVPFLSTLVNKFTGKVSHNEKIAVRVSCVIVFMSSLSNFVLLLFALWHKELTLYSWALPRADATRPSHSHTYLVLKTLILPVVTLTTFFASLSTDLATFVVYHVALLLVPILFVVLKLACACHCWRRGEGDGDGDDSSSLSGEESYQDGVEGEHLLEDVTGRQLHQRGGGRHPIATAP